MQFFVPHDFFPLDWTVQKHCAGVDHPDSFWRCVLESEAKVEEDLRSHNQILIETGSNLPRYESLTPGGLVYSICDEFWNWNMLELNNKKQFIGRKHKKMNNKKNVGQKIIWIIVARAAAKIRSQSCLPWDFVFFLYSLH